MSIPVIFSQNTTPTPTESNKPLIFGGTAPVKSTPAIFTQSTQQAPQVQPKQNIVQKIVQSLKSFSQNVSEQGLGGAFADLLVGKGSQPKEVVQQNVQTMVTAPKGEEMLTKWGLENVAIPAAKEANAGGAAVSAHMNALFTGDNVLNPKPMSSLDKEALQEAGALDDKGRVKPTYTAVATAKTTLTVAQILSLTGVPAFLPAEAFSDLITGGQTVRILGKAVTASKLISPPLIALAYGYAFSNGLAQDFNDPKVQQEALNNALISAGVVALINLPLQVFISPNAPQKPTVNSAKETRTLLAKFHPDAYTTPEEKAVAEKIFKTINSKYFQEGDYKWISELYKAVESGDQATIMKMLNNTKIPTGVGGYLPEKAGQVAPKAPTTPVNAQNVPPTNGASSVLQIIDSTNNTKIFKTIPAGDFSTIKNLVDGSSGIAGKNIEGKTYHLTAKTPEQMVNAGFTQEGTTSVKEVSSLKKGVEPKTVNLGQKKVVEPKVVETPVIKPKVVSVPRTQLPVGEEVKKASQLEARVRNTLDNVSQEQIDKLGLSTYKQMSNVEQIKQASDYVINNPEDALKVLQGDLEPPKGILKNSIYVAAVNNATDNIELMTKLASLQSTRYGQEIEILKEINKNSPVKFMDKLIKVRADAIQKKYNKPVEKVVKDEVAKIKKEIKAPSKWDWKSFVDSIEC